MPQISVAKVKAKMANKRIQLVSFLVEELSLMYKKLSYPQN